MASSTSRRRAAVLAGATLFVSLTLPVGLVGPLGSAPAVAASRSASATPRTDGSDPLGSLLNQVDQTVQHPV